MKKSLFPASRALLLSFFILIACLGVAKGQSKISPGGTPVATTPAGKATKTGVATRYAGKIKHRKKAHVKGHATSPNFSQDDQALNKIKEEKARQRSLK